MLEKVRAMAERNTILWSQGALKILGIRNVKDDGQPVMAFFDVEFPGRITIRNFEILKAPTGTIYVSSPTRRYKDPITGKECFERTVELPKLMMYAVVIKAVSAWCGQEEAEGSMKTCPTEPHKEKESTHVS